MVSTRRRSSYRPPTPKPYIQGPYLGMRDSLDFCAQDPGYAYLLENCYVQDPEIGGAVVGRPGFQQLGSQLAAGGRGQRSIQFNKLDGTRVTVVVCGGYVYTVNWASRTLTEVLNPTDFTGASITLSTTARVYAVVFANKVIFSDGINTPFAWDGTSHGGLTKLTNCPVLYGPPTVYYGSLFGIKNTDRTAIVWSEKNQPNVGYEAGGFNNAWTLGQTDQRSLVALRGTNEALYYWRARSLGKVVGAVSAQFATTGTHEAVSLEVGTSSPDAIVLTEDSFWFLDSDGRPQQLIIGGDLVQPPPWLDCKETVRHIPLTEIPDATGCYYSPAGLVRFGIAGNGATENNTVLNFNARTGRLVGIDRGYTFVTLDLVEDGDRDPRMLHLSTNGFVYDHGNPGGSVWNDNGAVIQHTLEGSPMGWDELWEKFWDRMDLSLRAPTNMTRVRVDLLTPRGRTTPQDFDVEGDFALWGSMVWGTDSWGGNEIETHQAVGWAEQGRWCRARIRHGVLGEQFGINSWRMTAYPLGPDPAVP